MTKTFTEAILENRAAIDHAAVYHLGVLLSTFSGLSPETLETHPLVQTFHETGAKLDELVTLATGFQTGESSSDIDARWGLVFEASDGERIAAIYINEFGSVISDGDHSFALIGADGAMATLRAAYGPDGVLG